MSDFDGWIYSFARCSFRNLSSSSCLVTIPEFTKVSSLSSELQPENSHQRQISHNRGNLICYFSYQVSITFQWSNIYIVQLLCLKRLLLLLSIFPT